MTIIDFYKELSRLLTDAREEFISRREAESKLDDLLDRAEESNLQVHISKEILDPVYLMRLDDERSFSSDEDYQSDSSYDSSF